MTLLPAWVDVMAKHAPKPKDNWPSCPGVPAGYEVVLWDAPKDEYTREELADMLERLANRYPDLADLWVCWTAAQKLRETP